MSSEKSKMEHPVELKPQNIGGEGPPEETLISIDGLVSGGRGVGRDEGRVWFVQGAIPGDRVWARAEHVRPRFIEGVAVRLEQASEQRRPAPCPHQSRCGGCDWMPLPEEVQREWKQRLVVDALERIAGVSKVPIEPVLHPSQPLGYRNRVEFSAGVGPGGEAVIGLWGRTDGRRSLIDLPDCLLQGERANATLQAIRRFVAERPKMRRELIDRGPFRILIREGSTGERLIGLWGAQHPFPFAAELARELAEGKDPADSIVSLRAKPGRRGGVRAEELHGKSTITERLGEFEFRLPAASFMQVNPAGGAALIDLVRRMAGNVRHRRVVDLFGGVGAFGLHLARAGARWVVVCDADRDAIEAGRRSARDAGLKQTRFVHETVQSYLRSQQGKPADLVVANPPRSGFGKGVARGILKLDPGRVIVVSCDPPTLARDLKPFLKSGYRRERVVPSDRFPQTDHVETVVLLIKAEDGSEGRGPPATAASTLSATRVRFRLKRN
jgi:23S rRNA (uracil1939-C5)-methyltransferase